MFSLLSVIVLFWINNEPIADGPVDPSQLSTIKLMVLVRPERFRKTQSVKNKSAV